jgi:hypothetical protein
MSNVTLNQANGRLLTIPAASVAAIISSDAARAPEDQPEARTLIFTTFRGFTSWWLQQSPRAVMEAVKAAEPKGSKRSWLEVPSVAEDSPSYIAPGSIDALEGCPGDEDGDPDYTRVWFPTPNGQATSLRASADSAVVESLQAAMEGKGAPEPKQTAPARKPGGPRKRH